MATEQKTRKKRTPVPDDAGFQTLKSRVYTTLREEILSGAASPGTRLVRRALSQRLGVSPIPVIEALHQLEQDGLVESEPMFGHRVRTLTIEGIRNDHVLREAIECQAARLCAQNSSDQQLAILMQKAEGVDKMLRSAVDSSLQSNEHLEFHMAIARSTGFPALVETLEKLWFRRLMMLNTLNASAKGLPRDWHARLVKAIATRDPDTAEKAMRKHVRFNVESQLEMLEINKLVSANASVVKRR